MDKHRPVRASRASCMEEQIDRFVFHCKVAPSKHAFVILRTDDACHAYAKGFLVGPKPLASTQHIPFDKLGRYY